MGLFDLFRTKCVICNRKIKPLRTYIDDGGKELKVCVPCSEYAERRAYKIKIPL
jgi:ribosome-binding protein aMBF1 (putative translation factor)